MKKFSFIIISSLLLHTSLFSANLHVLVCADTLTNMKLSSTEDLTHLRGFFNTVSNETGLKLNMEELIGKSLTTGNIITWLSKQKITSKDVLFFYYTGHGYRFPGKKSKLPTLHFPARQQSFDFADVVKFLRKKSARLTIALADACNNFTMDLTSTPGQKHVKEIPLYMKSPAETGIQKLFLSSKGLIVAAAAIPGERAWASKIGALFTNAFIHSVAYHSKSSNPTWGAIFTNLDSHNSLAHLATLKPLITLNVKSVSGK